MIDSGELRKGITIELDDKLYQVVEYQHIKVGRGSATVRLKLRDIRSGHNIDRSFQASEKFVRARLESRAMQYLYNDGDAHYFMDQETFEQMPINSSELGDALNYLKEGASLEVSGTRGSWWGSSCPSPSSWRLPRPGPATRETPPPPATSQPSWRPASPYRFLCLSITEISLRLTPAPACT